LREGLPLKRRKGKIEGSGYLFALSNLLSLGGEKRSRNSFTSTFWALSLLLYECSIEGKGFGFPDKVEKKRVGLLPIQAIYYSRIES